MPLPLRGGANLKKTPDAGDEQKPLDRGQYRSVRAEPGTTGAKTHRQKRQHTNRCSHKRQTHQLLTTLLSDDLDRLAAVQAACAGSRILTNFSNESYQDCDYG